MFIISEVSSNIDSVGILLFDTEKELYWDNTNQVWTNTRNTLLTFFVPSIRIINSCHITKINETKLEKSIYIAVPVDYTTGMKIGPISVINLKGQPTAKDTVINISNYNNS